MMKMPQTSRHLVMPVVAAPTSRFWLMDADSFSVRFFRVIFTTLAATLTTISTTCIGLNPVAAQIVPDGSTATKVQSNVIVPTGAGTVNGGNLYHSFDKFNVPSNGVVFGTGNSAVNGAQINNIINRVTGDTPSQILGTIESRQAFPNANLYLMNPNGVIFSKDAKLDVGGSFYATTGTGMTFAPGGNLGSNFQVDKNSTTFPNGDPQSIQFAATQPAAVINQGNLAVRDGQTLSLTGGTVVNTGNLSAPQGNITLQSVAGQQQVEIRSPNSVLGLSVTGLNPQWQGKLSDIPQLAALLTGPVPEANQVVVQSDGSLALVQSPTATNIPVNQGSMVFSGTANAAGGTVRLLGAQVALTNATINTASNNGGGSIFVGGDYQGQGTTPRANYTYISPTTFLKADALTNGNGGKVIIWADGLTRFFGNISAEGGANGGNGGFVEVSGKDRLQFNGNVTTFAPLGKNGSLLLDPTDINIVAGGSPLGSFVTAAGNSNYLPTNGGPDQILNTTIQTLLANNNVTISTASVGTATGILNVNAPITWNSANSLTLNANNTLTLNTGANITNTGTGSFTATSAGDLNVQSSIQLSGGNLSLTATAGNIIVNGTGQPISTGGGKMTFRSNQANTGTVTLVPGTVDSGGGDITFITDNISLGILTNTGGKVIIEPATPGRGILLTNGLADSSLLSLDASTISALNTNAYQLITIGNNNNSGDITSEGGVSLDKSPIQFLTPGNFIVAGASTYGDLQVTAANTKLFGNLAGTNRTFNSNLIIETSGVALIPNSTLGGGNVIITGTINGLTGTENFSITVNGAGSTGSLSLFGAVGNSQPLGLLSLNTGVNADLRAITAKGLAVNGFSGTVNFLGAVNLDSDGLDVGSTPPVTNINVGSPITILNSGFLTLKASGLLSVNGALTTNGGNTNLSGNTVNINAQLKGNTINQGSLNISATNAITIVAAAPIVSGAGTAIGFGGATSTSVAGSISSQGNMLFGSPVTLTGTTTIQSNDQFDGIVFQNTLNGAGQSLNLVSNALTFGNVVSGLGNLTLKPATNNYPVQLGGVAVNGSLSLTSTSLTNLFPGVTSLNVGGGTSGDITTVATVPDISVPLTLQPATGNKVVIQTPLIATGSGSLNVIGRLDLTSNITTAGGGITQSGGAVTLQSDSTLTSSNGAINLGGTIDGGFSLTVNAGSGNVTFSSALGGITPVGGLELNSTGLTSLQSLHVNTFLTGSGSRVTLNGDVASVNSQTYGGEVFIGGSGITLNSSANNGPISFASTVNSATATPTNLTINPGSGDITFQGAVGSTNRLGILTISRPAIFNVGVNQFDQNVTVDSLVTAQGGVSTIINGNITTNTTAGQVYNNPVFLKNNVLLDSSAGNGVIAFNSTLESVTGATPPNFNLTLAAGGGGVTFGNVVGGTSAAQNLNNLTINSASAINIANNITTVGSMTFNQPVNLTGSSVTLTSNTGGVTFGNTLNGNSSLTINGTGAVVFNGAVGNITPLLDLTVYGSQISLTDNFSTTSSLFFGAPVILSNARNTPITLTGGQVGFSGTLDGSRSLTVNSTLPASFSGDIGAATPLNSLAVITPNYTDLQNINVVGDLTLGNIQSTAAGTPVQLRSTSGNIVVGNITHIGNRDFPNGGPVNLVSDNGSITLGAIDTRASGSGLGGSGGSVLLQTKGSLTITGSVNTSTPNGGAGGSQTFKTGGVFTSGNLISSGITGGGDIKVTATNSITTGNIDSSASTGQGGNVTLDPIGNVVVGSINTSGATQGGNVALVSTGGALQLLNTITSAANTSCIGASICTAGGTGGTISLQHGGLNPFVVGSTAINGSAGFLTNGLNTVPVGTTIPVILGSDYLIGNIRITPGGIISILPVVSGPIFVDPTILSPLQPTQVVTNRVANISDITRTQVGKLLEQGKLAEAFDVLERGYQSELEVYTGKKLGGSGESGSAWVGIDEGQQLLAEISQRTGSSAALIYPVILDDRIEIMVIPPKDRGAPFRRTSSPTTPQKVNTVLQDYTANLRDTVSQDYLEQSRQLYDWVILPIDAELQRQKIDTLVFVMDGAMRIVPPAALHDGKQFLIERYATVNIPSLRLTRLEYRDRANNRVLAMGLTEAVSGFSRLPSVEVELRTISQQVLNGQSFLNKDFTIENMQQQRRNNNYGIVHLGTHGKFVSDTSKGSFIQFWDNRLQMDQITKLRFDSPVVEMMTLSACETAVGSNLGISGLAIESGARSVLASLWTVSDAGTAPLMISFYRDFPDAVHKAAALRSAQISLLSGKVRMDNGMIQGITGINGVKLPEASGNIDLRHPFYWSSFILVGNWL